MRKRMARPNSKEVASAAGISTQTNSRVIEALEYKLSATASGWISQPHLLNGLASAIEQVVYSLPIKELPLYTKYNQNIRAILQEMLSQHLGGIICAVPEVYENHSWIHDAALDMKDVEIIGFDRLVESAFFSPVATTV